MRQSAERGEDISTRWIQHAKLPKVISEGIEFPLSEISAKVESPKLESTIIGNPVHNALADKNAPATEIKQVYIWRSFA